MCLCVTGGAGSLSTCGRRPLHYWDLVMGTLETEENITFTFYFFDVPLNFFGERKNKSATKDPGSF